MTDDVHGRGESPHEVPHGGAFMRWGRGHESVSSLCAAVAAGTPNDSVGVGGECTHMAKRTLGGGFQLVKLKIPEDVK